MPVEDKKISLTMQEKYIAKLQQRLIDQRGDLTKFIDDEQIKDYALQTAAHYFPKRTDNESYMQPIIDSFAVDLATAPRLHDRSHLWRKNYDDLDILSKLYKGTHSRNGYFHIATGSLPELSREDFQGGLQILDIDLGDHEEIIWHASELRGKRSLVAKRIVEAIGGLDFDRQMNEIFGFAENISERNLRKKTGRGKFQYVRRGRLWMALGTARNDLTINLREQHVSNLWGYQIRYDKRAQKIRISLSAQNTQNCKAQICGILDSGMSMAAQLKKSSDFYRQFYERHRFANDAHWYELDMWALRRTKKLRRALGVAEWKIFMAHTQRTGISTYLPRRCNFFWDIERELNCAYRSIWNPYRF